MKTSNDVNDIWHAILSQNSHRSHLARWESKEASEDYCRQNSAVTTLKTLSPEQTVSRDGIILSSINMPELY